MQTRRFPSAVLSAFVLVGVSAAFAPSRSLQAMTHGTSRRSEQAPTASERKEAKLRELMTAMNQRETIAKSTDQSLEAFRKMGLSDDFISGFKDRFDVDHIVDMSVEVFAEHLEEETVDAMIAFYTSEQGKELASKLPEISLESLKRGQAYGEEVARDVMQGK